MNTEYAGLRAVLKRRDAEVHDLRQTVRYMWDALYMVDKKVWTEAEALANVRAWLEKYGDKDYR